ncbi:MAG: preprotein translocase subunit SecG [Dysgonamonadaceae bacterium]|jgi:preprotein translocase subunit SecG|nr:preprotein translocase subunit SecG [Dysgonamonadaceae bacterium]
MYTFITILIVILSMALIFFVVIQNSKGGGLAAGFSSSNQIMGVRRTTDFLEKATATLAISIVVLSIFASISVARRSNASGDSLKDEMMNIQENTTNPNATAPFGTAVPSGGSGGQELPNE